MSLLKEIKILQSFEYNLEFFFIIIFQYNLKEMIICEKSLVYNRWFGLPLQVWNASYNYSLIVYVIPSLKYESYIFISRVLEMLTMYTMQENGPPNEEVPENTQLKKSTTNFMRTFRDQLKLSE